MADYQNLLEENYETYIKKKKKKKSYYVIQEGENKGIYYNWSEIKEKINKNTNYSKFTKKQDAIDYLEYNYCSEDLQLEEEKIALLSYNKKEIYDIVDSKKSPFNIYKLNKNSITDGDNRYIFVSGKSKKLKKNLTKSIFSIYFGSQTINISDFQETETDIEYILAIEFIINLLDKNKASIKDYHKKYPSSVIFIVLDNVYNYNLFKYWIRKWCSNNWKTYLEEDIKNKNMIKSIYFKMSKLKLHKINFDFKFINSNQLPPSEQLEAFLWKNNLYAKYLVDIAN